MEIIKGEQASKLTGKLSLMKLIYCRATNNYYKYSCNRNTKSTFVRNLKLKSNEEGFYIMPGNSNGSYPF